MEQILSYKKGELEGGISEIRKKGVSKYIAVAGKDVKSYKTLKSAKRWMGKKGYEPANMGSSIISETMRQEFDERR